MTRNKIQNESETARLERKRKLFHQDRDTPKKVGVDNKYNPNEINSLLKENSKSKAIEMLIYSQTLFNWNKVAIINGILKSISIRL